MIISRIGRVPIVIPAGVKIDCYQQELLAVGPKGSLKLTLHPFIQVEQEAGKLQLSLSDKKNIRKQEYKVYDAIAGTTRANIYNVLNGVSQGFETKLILVGVGYRAQMNGKMLILSLGFSSPVQFPTPLNIIIETPVQTEILIKGVDKVLVGQTAACVRRKRPPECYKGKGIRYFNEVIDIKETKKK